MPARPLPPRTKSRRALRRAAVADGSFGVVEECAGRAREKDGVVLLEIGVVDVGRVVGNGRRPGTGLLADLFDRSRRERDRRVHETRRPGQHEDLARLLRLGRRRGGQCRHHRRDVFSSGCLVLRWRAASPAGRGCCRKHRAEPHEDLLERQRIALGFVPLGVPLVERALQLLTSDGAVLVGVDEREEGRRWSAALPLRRRDYPVDRARTHSHSSASHGQQISRDRTSPSHTPSSTRPAASIVYVAA